MNYLRLKWQLTGSSCLKSGLSPNGIEVRARMLWFNEFAICCALFDVENVLLKNICQYNHRIFYMELLDKWTLKYRRLKKGGFSKMQRKVWDYNVTSCFTELTYSQSKQFYLSYVLMSFIIAKYIKIFLAIYL